MTHPWTGKKVAFFGDSITDAQHLGTEKNYWQFLEDKLQITPLVYGINGRQWDDIPRQAEQLFADHGESTDAIIIFIGTNDYNGSVPPGRWWDTRKEEVCAQGQMVWRMRRIANTDPDTLRGRINRGLAVVKDLFIKQQIILCTPIHRGYANFSETNIQPEESYPNALGMYVDEYVDIIKEAGAIWSVPVIDLFGVSGLLPMRDGYAQYFSKQDTDRLHPNTAGHARIAETLYYQLSALPPHFKG